MSQIEQLKAKSALDDDLGVYDNLWEQFSDVVVAAAKSDRALLLSLKVYFMFTEDARRGLRLGFPQLADLAQSVRGFAQKSGLNRASLISSIQAVLVEDMKEEAGSYVLTNQDISYATKGESNLLNSVFNRLRSNIARKGRAVEIQDTVLNLVKKSLQGDAKKLFTKMFETLPPAVQKPQHLSEDREKLDEIFEYFTNKINEIDTIINPPSRFAPFFYKRTEKLRVPPEDVTSKAEELTRLAKERNDQIREANAAYDKRLDGLRLKAFNALSKTLNLALTNVINAFEDRGENPMIDDVRKAILKMLLTSASRTPSFKELGENFEGVPREVIAMHDALIKQKLKDLRTRLKVKAQTQVQQPSQVQQP